MTVKINIAKPQSRSGADLPLKAELEAKAVDLVGILSSVEETAYTWDLANDTIEWESNVNEVLRLKPPVDVSTGSAFQLLEAAEHIARRHEAIAGARAPEAGKGVPYRVQYRFLPSGRRSDASLWLEDHGRWWSGREGLPVKARGVVRVINERYLEEQRLLYRSDHDELTGQLNRIRLTEALTAVINRADRSGQSCAFMVAGVNNLAVINETFGFDVGDEVIAAVARVIKEKLRGGDTIGRYSSNKFGIILNECGPAALRVAADRFIKAVRDTKIRTSACQLAATVSIGGVLLPDQARTTHQAIAHALQAHDRAKLKRYDCFMAFEPSPVRETTRRRNLAIADEVITALDEDRMLLLLQPIVSAKTGKPALYECLLRMRRHDGTLVSAGEFIPVAEQLGLARLIDKRVLELSVDLLQKTPGLKISLNVSSLTAGDHDWLVTLHKLTGGKGDLTSRMTVEITETAAIHDLDQTVAFVDTLKELGCNVAIDDFGAGYTSFRNLKLLNVDMVKIDGDFVKNICDNESDRVFIKTMVELAATFEMETVAEWVGDKPTAEIVRAAGITYMQGYHFGLPIDPSELPKIED